MNRDRIGKGRVAVVVVVGRYSKLLEATGPWSTFMPLTEKRETTDAIAQLRALFAVPMNTHTPAIPGNPATY